MVVRLAFHSIITVFLLCTISGLPAAAQAEPAPVASQPGLRAVATGEYKFPAAVDASVLAQVPTELWARAWWPKDRTAGEKWPIVFLLHGNHATCGLGSRPRSDSGCGYTLTGSCGDGETVVPNHEGYAYLGTLLASHGLIAVSINANRGITCSSGEESDWGLNLARGRLILRHMQAWSAWSAEGGAPESLGGSEALRGSVDWARTGLFGHSRGGEGARAAYDLYLDPGSPWPAKIPGARVRAIFEVGAVDGQTNRTLDAVGTAWNQLLPMCDGDVSDLEGRLPFERMMAMRSERPMTPKSLTMVWGANHNFFNTEWQRSDSDRCQGGAPIFDPDASSSEAQQKIARELVAAFFRSHLNGPAEEPLGRAFDPLWEPSAALSAVGRVDRDFAPTIDQSLFARVDDFDRPTGMSSNGVANAANLITVRNQRDGRPVFSEISWGDRSGDAYLQVNWAEPAGGRDARAFGLLSFRVARAPVNPDVESTSTDFSISLVDASGMMSPSVQLSAFVDLAGPPNPTITFQTARIPLNAFPNVDLARLVGVRFSFDRSPAGKIELANVRLGAAPSDMPPWQTAQRLSALRPPPESPGRPRSRLSEAAPAPPIPSTARLISTHRVSHSRYFSTSPEAFDLVFLAARRFPVQDALPYLSIGGRLFPGGRYARNGELRELTFTIPRTAWATLPEGAAVRIQYGAGRSPGRIWEVPTRFSRAER